MKEQAMGQVIQELLLTWMGISLIDKMACGRKLFRTHLVLQQAAESGSINDLYALIDENPCILENIDAMPFVNTPLHIAASCGEIQTGAKDQQELVTWLLRIDPSLAGVKGREGITLFHLLVLRGNVDLVVECLITSPECIKDVSVNGQNALLLAVVNERFEVL
ncbi:hypothetical protein YC2023_057592 [Brassica napus]